MKRLKTNSLDLNLHRLWLLLFHLRDHELKHTICVRRGNFVVLDSLGKSEGSGELHLGSLLQMALLVVLGLLGSTLARDVDHVVLAYFYLDLVFLEAWKIDFDVEVLVSLFDIGLGNHGLLLLSQHVMVIVFIKVAAE